MIIKDEIRESKVNQGDLVFIYHKTKPYKTGWWRKIREGSTKNDLIYYILEKPMHKDFNIENEINSASHTELGLCVMKNSTIRYCAANGIDKYEIMADIKGVHSVFLSTRGYHLADVLYKSNYDIDEDKDNVIITKRFKKLIDLYLPKKTGDIEILSTELIK